MTKEEYLAITASIEKQRDELNVRQDQAEQDYIASHREFENGDKVRIDKYDRAGKLVETEYGYVVDYEVNVWGEIKPKLAAAKKDRTMHHHKMIWLGFRENYKLTKVD